MISIQMYVYIYIHGVQLYVRVYIYYIYIYVCTLNLDEFYNLANFSTSTVRQTPLMKMFILNT